MGWGEVGIGAKEMLDHFKMVEISPDDLKNSDSLDPSWMYYTILNREHFLWWNDGNKFNE